MCLIHSCHEYSCFSTAPEQPLPEQFVFCTNFIHCKIYFYKMIPFVGLSLEIVQESVELPRIFRRHYWLELTSESLKDFGGQEMRGPFIMPTITDCRPT